MKRLRPWSALLVYSLAFGSAWAQQQTLVGPPADAGPTPQELSSPPASAPAPAPAPKLAALERDLQELLQRVRKLEAQRDSLEDRLAKLEHPPLPGKHISHGPRALQSPSPPVKLPTTGGYSFHHLWSTTCSPCIKELSSVVAFAKLLSERQVKVSFIAEEFAGDEQKARDLFRSHGGDERLLEIKLPGPAQVNHRGSLGVARDGRLPLSVFRHNSKNLLVRDRVLFAEDRAEILSLLSSAAATAH